ncbi:MAG: DUF2919 family protein [Steroidobacteraceae bacterium]|jgi:hypothetical protein
MSRYTHSHAQTYPAASYDDYLCLKPPLLLWIVILYLSKVITLPIAMAVASFSGVNPDAIKLIRSLWSAESLLPSLIAILVLFALLRRMPSASKPVRWIWAHGRTLLALSAGIDLVLALVQFIRVGELNDQTVLSLMTAGIDLYFLVYVLAARRVRDAFGEFPPPLDPAA